ncbi:integrin alpha-X-like [Hoplias malabaricus]|uniref:integrin alpha-X-like n=1 Tax=Hoplias malabaricus TaxID=27720 RepID=UPI00346248CD
MDWSHRIYFLLFSVSQSVVAFNIESEAWRRFSQSSNVAFGYKVIQKDPSSLIVSDPLLQSRNKRGQIYRCDVNQPGNCSPLQMNEPPEAVNMSLGLSMTKDPRTSKIMACGPTIPKDCKVTTTYNGMCLTVDRGNFKKVPNTLRDCPPPPQTDIAFLLDGSGSVNRYDFASMKKFVLTLSQGLSSRDVRFAVAQYSSYCEIHLGFTSTLNSYYIDSISQMRGYTYTGAAINKLVDELFAQRARPNAKRVLIVITDGESTDGEEILRRAAENAKSKNIIRYAIGVGRAFNSWKAENELNIIASDPDNEYKFKVGSFAVLDQILKTLEANIIAIEGTQASGDSTRMEFAQDGFSAAFIPNEIVILSAVGAYQWKGGYQEYTSGQLYAFQQGSEHDSYLGYSMTVTTVLSEPFIVLGAPRHGHKGAVVVTRWRTQAKTQLNSPEPQTGAYFGAEVCGVDLNSDSNTDLLLVSAPLHTQDNREGKVFVYSMSNRQALKITLEGMAGQRGRFGSSLASPADLNGDNVRDVVVGAPLEDDGQGSIYIFNGRQSDINPIYSQRISGSSVRSGLQFFGISLSESAVDHSGDSLPDIAVGSKGTVEVLRSRPVVTLTTKVTYNPLKISTKQTDCTNPQENTLTVCFTMSEINSPIRGLDLSGKVNYRLKLDAKRQTSRAYFSEKNRLLSNKVTVSVTRRKCTDHMFFIEPCPEDALNPLINEVTFTFEGVPISSKGNLKPVLLPAIKNSSDHNLDFEINCGSDNICMDDLKVDFNFSGQSDIKVGIMQELNITVFVENHGENSYNSHVQLTYPFGLSFRKFTSKQGRVECSSLDSEQIGSLGTTTCYINKPILRQNTVGVFEITYSINTDSDFNKMVSFTATAASGNDEHSPLSELTQNKTIGVKYAIYVAIVKHESSSLHINFTSGKYDLEKPVTQIFKVENDLRDVNLTIFISVPIKLGDKDIWTDKDLQIPDCSKDRDEKPKTSDFVAALKLSPEVNCTVATCRIFRCNIMLLRQDVKLYNISANVGSGWIQQTELRSVVFELVSTATMEYDTNTYLYFSSDSLHTAPIGRIITQVEVYEEKDLLKETIGGAVGGLLLLALITAGLYKAGFFKSQYKQMLEEAGGDGADGAAAPEGDLS